MTPNSNDEFKNEGLIDRLRHKRANYERDVIDASAKLLDKKQTDSNGRATSLKKRIEEKGAEAVRRYNAGEDVMRLTELRMEVEEMEGSLALERQLSQMFSNTKLMLRKLLVYTNALIQMGDYSFVIRTIPQRKIPRYVKASRASELSLVTELVSQLLTTVQDRITIVGINKKELDEMIVRENGIAETMREEHTESNAEKKAKMDDFIARMRQGNASYAVPSFPAEAEAAAKDATANNA